MIERIAQFFEREAGHIVVAVCVMLVGAALMKCCGMPTEGHDILVAGSTLLARATGGAVIRKGGE